MERKEATTWQPLYNNNIMKESDYSSGSNVLVVVLLRGHASHPSPGSIHHSTGLSSIASTHETIGLTELENLDTTIPPHP